MYALLFDLDGVLIDSKHLHYEALNLALSDIDSGYTITKSEQESVYEGLPTKAKLNILHLTKGLPKSKFDIVWHSKQKYTAELFSTVGPDYELANILESARRSGAMIGVVSNSIRETLDVCLTNLGIYRYFDVSISNEDVSQPKPSPEPYLLAMTKLNIRSSSCAIFEDSDIGKRSALAAGGILIPIANRKDLTLEKVQLVCQKLATNIQ
jgi:HAD superfamily hydrolase (TIGR01509 family)